MDLKMAYSLTVAYVAAHPDPTTIESARDLIDGRLQHETWYQALSHEQRGTVHQNVAKRLKDEIGVVVLGRQKAPKGSSATAFTLWGQKPELEDGNTASQE